MPMTMPMHMPMPLLLSLQLHIAVHMLLLMLKLRCINHIWGLCRYLSTPPGIQTHSMHATSPHRQALVHAKPSDLFTTPFDIRFKLWLTWHMIVPFCTPSDFYRGRTCDHGQWVHLHPLLPGVHLHPRLTYLSIWARGWGLTQPRRRARRQ